MQPELQFNATLNSMVFCVCHVSLCNMDGVTLIEPQKIDEVLNEFKEVPTSMPPKRTHDHQIPLLPNTPPVNIRPYRHPPSQKDAIEHMVKELLESGVIRSSESSFSSPIIMVKKKDGSWRMCVDYRKLNKHTVKDKFLIPMIEELIESFLVRFLFSL